MNAAMSTDDRFNWSVFCTACSYSKTYTGVSRRGIRFIIDAKCTECKKVNLDAVELGNAA